MAQEVDVEFASFWISSYLDQNFELVVSTSALLSVPVQCSGICTAADLRDQVQNGTLWVSRAGSCRIELSIGFGGSLNDGSRQYMQRMCVDAFESFAVWEALGLELRREYNQFNEPRGSRSLYPYSVQHNQQNSGLILPDQVPCAYLSVLSCNFTLKSKNTSVDRHQSTTVDKPRNTKIDHPENTSCNFLSTAAKKYQSLSTDQSMPLPRKSKIVTLKAPPIELRRIIGLPEICSLPLSLQEKRLEHLTHTALHLVFGARKRFAGLQILKKPGSLTALEVTPAVWSVRYFQDVISRVQLACFVSSALGNLMSTDSPIHQHKMQSLGRDPFQEIHRQTVLLVLRSARVPRLLIQASQVGSHSQVVADSMVDADGIHNSHEPQEDIQERNSHEARQQETPHVGTSLDFEDEMDLHHHGSDLAHEDATIGENGLGIDVELAMEHELPHSGSHCASSQPIPEDFEEMHVSAQDQLLDGEGSQAFTASWMQTDDDLELQNDLVTDVMDEEDAEDRNSERELCHGRVNRHRALSDAQLCSDDAESEHDYRVCLGSETEGERSLSYRQSVYGVDHTENRQAENGDDDHWPERSHLMGTGGFYSHCRAQHSQIGYNGNRTSDGYNTDDLDYEMDQSFGGLEDEHQYGELSTCPNTEFTDEDAACMTTRQLEPDETESFLDEPWGEDAEDFGCHGRNGELELSAGDRHYGEEIPWPSASCYRYQNAPGSGFENRSSRVTETRRSTVSHGFSLSPHSSLHSTVAPAMDYY